jgi:hypothetical protein
MNSPIVGVIGGAVVAVVLFLLARELLCWYWKINEIVSLLKQNNALLSGQLRLETADDADAKRKLAASTLASPAVSTGSATRSGLVVCPNCGKQTPESPMTAAGTVTCQWCHKGFNPLAGSTA